MSQTAQVTPRTAVENREYVRKLLRRRQPEFAAALASAERELTCQAGLPQPRTCRLCRTRPAPPRTTTA